MKKTLIITYFSIFLVAAICLLSIHGNNFTLFYHLKSKNYYFPISLLPIISIIIGLIGIVASGNIFQYTVRNELASPSSLGIFPAVSISFTISKIFLYKIDLWLSFGIAFIITILILLLINFLNNKNNNEIILIGFSISIILIIINYIINLQMPSNNLTFKWFQDKNYFTSQKTILGASVIIPSLFFAFIFGKKLTIFKRSILRSQIVGNNNQSILYGYLILGSLISISSLIVIGEIAFVGIAIPNITRYILKSDHFLKNCLFGFFLIIPFGFVAKILEEMFIVSFQLIITIISGPFFICFLIFKFSKDHH